MVAEQVTTTNSTCDGRRPKNRSRPHQAAHDKMPKESPKDKPTNQLEQNTVEVPQVQNQQIEKADTNVTDLSAVVNYFAKLNDSDVDKAMKDSPRHCTESTLRDEKCG